MIILLAGLQAIPREQYEAARVDGASPLREFWHITIPNLKRMIVIAIALDTIWQFRRFGLVYTMTQGGPGHSTEILSILVYKQYFRFFNFEYAAAIAVILAIIMLIISLPYIRMIVRRV
jgi:multiple sugar transport system permease protein